MSEVGISDIAIYIPQFYLPYEELAKARGIPKEKYQVGLGNQNMSVIPNYEDAVTMAANSAIQLLEKSGTDPYVILYIQKLLDKKLPLDY
jgi:hydroxymethylglutaryl-CoA synthase